MGKPALALIEYFTTGDETLIFVIRREYDEPKVEEVKFPLGELHKLVKNFRSKVESLSDVDDELEQLSQHFIKPVLDKGYLSGNDYLYIVPHGDLHYLPFHAFVHDGGYLGEQFPIVYLPSASVLRFCQAKRKESKETCLSIGVGREIDSEMVKRSFHQEAEWVANLFGERALMGLEASKQRVQEESKDKDVIHFSCHGLFDTKQPMSSGLLLSDGKNLPVDGEKYTLRTVEKGEFLTARDVLSMELHANLVTLGGCQTGVNDVKPGDELIGLTRSFIYAGTPSVLVSLWNVDTYSAQALMEKFYRFWKEDGLTKISALHRAQKEVMNLTAQEVITAYKKEREIATRQNDRFSVAFVETRLAATYVELNDFFAAEACYLSARQTFNQLQKPIDEAHVWQDLEKMYTTMGELGKAKECDESRLELLKTLPIIQSSTSRDIQIMIDPSQKQRPAPRNGLQKKTPSTKIYRHPFYWAPFVLVGDWK